MDNFFYQVKVKRGLGLQKLTYYFRNQQDAIDFIDKWKITDPHDQLTVKCLQFETIVKQPIKCGQCNGFGVCGYCNNRSR